MSLSHDETGAVIPPQTPEPVGPTRTSLPDRDPRFTLHENVREALSALPLYFTSPVNIEGLDAGDLFSLNGLLGGTIEAQTVATLNRVRNVWDPKYEWEQY